MPIMLRPFKHFADFNGRARRAEYWQFCLLQFLVYVIFIFMAFLSFTDKDISGAIMSFMVWFGLIGLAALIFFIPNLAVLARRLHDINLSAWWMALLLPSYVSHFISIGGGFSAIAQIIRNGSVSDINSVIMRSMAMSGLFILIATACSLILFVMTLLPGTGGANRFGPDPKSGQNNDSSGFDETQIAAAIDRAKQEQSLYKPAAYTPNVTVSQQQGFGQKPSFGKRR